MNGLRPLSLGELLDSSIRIYRSKAKALLAAVAVPVLPVVVFQTLVTWSTQPDDYRPFQAPTDESTIKASDLLLQLTGALVGTFAIFLATSLATAACFRIVSSAYLGGDVTWRESLAFVRTRFWAVLGLSLLVLVCTLGGLAACLVGVIVPMTFLSVAMPALLMEGQGVGGAFRRSVDLVQGRFGPVLGAVLVSSLLAFVFQGVIASPLIALMFSDPSTLVLNVVTAVVNAIALVLVTPFTVAFTMALYVDLRVRKEGFDLQLWAQRVGADPAAAVDPDRFPQPQSRWMDPAGGAAGGGFAPPISNLPPPPGAFGPPPSALPPPPAATGPTPGAGIDPPSEADDRPADHPDPSGDA